MFELIAILCVIVAIGLLIALSIIDLRHWILPDKLNLAFGISGIVFHFTTGYYFFDIQTMILGGAIGAGMLYAIRYISNRHHGRDTLGLGDVKLMGAAGLWLGIDGVLIAITLGAFAGLIHGLCYAGYIAFKNKTTFSISKLSIPAGPGFTVGILIAGVYLFHDHTLEMIHDLLA